MEQKKGKKVYFEFTGGEVTFYPHFDELMGFIRKFGGVTGIITNASRPLSWWKERATLVDHVCASFHPERGDQEKFLEVMKFLREKTSLHVNVMMLPEKFSELYQFAETLVQELPGVSVAIQPLFRNFTEEIFSYTPEQLRLLKEPGFSYSETPKGLVVRGPMKALSENGETEDLDPTLIISRGENRWKGWECSAGVEDIAVGPSGDVTRGLCRAGGVLGNIQGPFFDLPGEGIVCPFESCHCAFDIMCTKSRPGTV